MRFRLRELTEADISERYVCWFSDPDAQRYIVTSKQAPTAASLREYVRQRANRSDVLFLGIFDKATGLHIGNVKYEPVDSAQGYAVMGILIGEPGFRGKGVAREVLSASGQWLKLHRGIKQVLLAVNRDHLGAIRAYEKAGFLKVTSKHITQQDNGWITMGWSL